MALTEKKTIKQKHFQSKQTTNPDFDSLQYLLKILGHEFKNPQLLTDALTLASGCMRAKYERLEFLGDRVLGLVVAEMLYRHFPMENEGELALRHTALVKGKTAATLAKSIGIDKCIKVPKSEENNMITHPETFLADIFESVIGALYMDGGYDVARDFVQRQCTPLMLAMAEPPIDAKTKLQEWLQAKGNPTPTYNVIDVTGPAHLPTFTVEIDIPGYAKAKGVGSSKKIAETAAALNFLIAVGVIKDKTKEAQGNPKDKKSELPKE